MVDSRIVIAGTGGMGREAAAWVTDSLGAGAALGFVDSDRALQGSEIAGLPVLGGDEWLGGREGIAVVPALGAPGARADLVRRLDAAGVPLETVVHTAAYVGPRVTIGSGSIVCPGAVITCDATLGRASIVNYGAMVGHDCVLGSFCFVGPGVTLAGNVRMGRGVEVGIGASVVQGVTIGDGAVIGAGAVVIGDIPSDATAVGVPARPF